MRPSACSALSPWPARWPTRSSSPTVTGPARGELVEAIREAVARQVLEVDERPAPTASATPCSRGRLRATCCRASGAGSTTPSRHWLAEPAAATEPAHGLEAPRRARPPLVRRGQPRRVAAASVDRGRRRRRPSTPTPTRSATSERAIDLWGRVGEPEALAGVDRATLLDRASQAADRDGQGSLAVDLGSRDGRGCR